MASACGAGSTLAHQTFPPASSYQLPNLAMEDVTVEHVGKLRTSVKEFLVALVSSLAFGERDHVGKGGSWSTDSSGSSLNLTCLHELGFSLVRFQVCNAQPWEFSISR